MESERQQPSQGKPDLVVASPSVSDGNPAAGETFTLSAMVRNHGDGGSPATTLRYYRSTDTAIAASDVAVGTDAVAGLAASESSSESVQLTAPSAPGTHYYYGACVDAVAEDYDTTNNCSPSVSVTVVGAVPIPGAVPLPSSPSISIALSPGDHVPPNTAITATVRLTSLDPATYSSVLFRADLTVFGHGETRCDGDDTGKDVEVPVQASREVFTSV